MLKSKFSRGLIAIVLCLGLALVFSGCAGSSSKDTASTDPFNFYNQVQLGDTKTAVDKALGVTPEETDGAFTYKDPNSGFGITVNYDAGDMVSMKMIYNADDTKIMDLSNAKVNEDQGASITEGMTYEAVKGILGSEGTEIIRLANPVDVNTPTSMMIWFNKDHTGFYIAFAGEKGTVQSVKFWK